jgi:UDP-N-acetylmuramoylalanine--D-glutamate ligase
LSSFQLEWLGGARLSPQYACITNLSPDHLNRHGTMEAYAAAKAQIFRHQGRDGVVALNANDALLRRMGQELNAVAWFAGAWNPQDAFVPERIAYWGDEMLIWQTQFGKLREQIVCTAEVLLPGRHNLENIAAAAAMCSMVGVEQACIRAAVRSFSGVEHRLEPVRELDGVRYINDTAATNPVASIAALESFESPIVLLAGGADKQLELSAFARRIAERAKALVLLAGSATARLQHELNIQNSIPVLGPYDDFAQALETARGLAEAGDVVLLSPGCASFGMFRNEFHRGEEFRRLVLALNGRDSETQR